MESAKSDRWGSNPDLRVWAIVAAFWAASAAIFSTAHFKFELEPAVISVAPTLVGAAICVMVLIRMPGNRLARVVSVNIQFGLAGMAMVMLALSAARIDRPFVDESLLSFDRSLGYRWESLTAFVASHSTIEQALSRVYFSLAWQPALISILLVFDDDIQILNRYILSYLGIFVGTIIVFSLWPATTAWDYLGISQAEIQHRHLVQTLGWTSFLRDIRSGSSLTVTMQTNFAIIGFPSFHCAAAVVNASFLSKRRFVRYVVLGANAVMIAATPMLGGHYLADIIAGTMLALSMVAIMQVAVPLRSLGPKTLTTTNVAASQWEREGKAIYVSGAHPQAVGVSPTVDLRPTDLAGSYDNSGIALHA